MIAARWLALVAALVVTTMGVALIGPAHEAEYVCRDDPHPGIPASNHYPDFRVLPPMWACRYEILDSERVLWREEQYTALYVAIGLGVVLLALVVAFRRRPPSWLQGLVVAWLVLGAYGAFATWGAEAAWGSILFALPCIAFSQHDLARRLRPAPALRWWWVGVVGALVWLATVAQSLADGGLGSPWPGLALGALLGAVAPRYAKYPAEP